MRTFFYYALLGASGALIGLTIAQQGDNVWNYWPFYLLVASAVLTIAFEFSDLYKGA